MDQKMQDYVKNCFQITYELQSVLSKNYTLGFNILLIHSNTDDGLDDYDISNQRSEFAKSYVKMMKMIPNSNKYKNKQLLEKLDEFKICAAQIRKDAYQNKLVREYALEYFQEFSQKQLKQ